MRSSCLLTTVTLLLPLCVFAQTTGKTAEESLLSGSDARSETMIGGYGNVDYQRNLDAKTSFITVKRFVLFVGHNFGGISFFSETEIEDAKVEGGEKGGEVALEQAYLKFDLDRNHYLTAGLFIPRFGIINENHLPNSYNGTERPRVETSIIPTTWRELGVGFYGSSAAYPISYSVALMNGLNSAAFKKGSVIRSGRYSGREAGANNLAVAGSLQWDRGVVRLQASGYYGGTVSLAPNEADSLRLESGPFGTPVAMAEANVQFESNGFSGRALGAVISIPDAFAINRAYKNNTPRTAYGAYLELAYNLLHSEDVSRKERLLAFVRYEKLDMNAQVPQNVIRDGAVDQHHVVGGLVYLPHPNVAAKADVRLQRSSDSKKKSFLNLGLGFSF